MGNRIHDTKRARRSERARTSGVRGQRLEELIREEVNFLLDSEIVDPNLEGVRITTVVLSPDGARARLHYVMTGTESIATHRHEPDAALRRATGFFRRCLCDALSLKRTPELRFVVDLSQSFHAALEEER